MAGLLKISSNFLPLLTVVCDKHRRYMNDIDLSHLWNGAVEIRIGE